MTIITVPQSFSFWTNGVTDFDKVLEVLDWNAADRDLSIDLESCSRANYQTLALLVPYVWKLKVGGRNISIDSSYRKGTPGQMWQLMGARGWSQVLYNEGQQFSGASFKPLIAIRNQRDFGAALSKIEEYTKEALHPILIDNYTRQNLPADILVEDLGKIVFKGKNQAINVFAVMGSSA